MTNVFSYPHIGSISKGSEIYDSFQRAELHPTNAIQIYQTYYSGEGEAKISQNNRFMMVTDKKSGAFATAIVNGIGFGRQVKFNQITDDRTTLEFNIHLEFINKSNLKAFVGLYTGAGIMKDIPDENKRYCGVKIDTTKSQHLQLGNSNTELEEITDLIEFDSIHYRLHILWKTNDIVILSLYRGKDFKTLIGTHESTSLASKESEEIETFFLHWFIQTTDKNKKSLLTKGWWVKAT